MRLLVTAFIVSFGPIFSQPYNEAVPNEVDDAGKIQKNFQNLFDSIKKNELVKTETYRTFLEQETAREQQAFANMKEEIRNARQKNRFDKKDGRKIKESIVSKRETNKEEYEPVSNENLDSSTEPEYRFKLKPHLGMVGVEEPYSSTDGRNSICYLEDSKRFSFCAASVVYISNATETKYEMTNGTQGSCQMYTFKRAARQRKVTVLAYKCTTDPELYLDGFMFNPGYPDDVEVGIWYERDRPTTMTIYTFSMHD